MTEPLPTVSTEEMKEKGEKKEEKKEEKKKENKGGNMAKAKGISDFILPIGILVLGYYTLKNWGIIDSHNLSLSWRPLTEGEIQNIDRIIE